MDFKGRSFLKLLDYTAEEMSCLIDFAAELKQKKKARKHPCLFLFLKNIFKIILKKVYTKKKIYGMI